MKMQLKKLSSRVLLRIGLLVGLLVGVLVGVLVREVFATVSGALGHFAKAATAP